MVFKWSQFKKGFEGITFTPFNREDEKILLCSHTVAVSLAVDARSEIWGAVFKFQTVTNNMAMAVVNHTIINRQNGIGVSKFFANLGVSINPGYEAQFAAYLRFLLKEVTKQSQYDGVKIGQRLEYLPNQSQKEDNCWYPRHVTDRVDLMIDQLDDKNTRLLYEEYTQISTDDWLAWFLSNWNEISNYDLLADAERVEILEKNPNGAILKQHHACIFLDLWRARLENSFLQLPPHGPPIEDVVDQRLILLTSLVSYLEMYPEDYWPFKIPEGQIGFPFIECDSDN